MDRKKFTSLYQAHAALVRRVIGRRGIKGADLEEVCQDVWTDLWNRREVWPDPEPSNPGAYLAECARRKAKMHFRAAGALKRAGVHVPIEEDRTSTGFEQKSSVILSKPPEAEGLVEQTSLGTFLRRLAERVGGEKKQIMLDHLDNKVVDVPKEDVSGVRRGFKRMVASCRRQLGIPVKDPTSLRVDPVTHLASVVRGFRGQPDVPVEAELSDA